MENKKGNGIFLGVIGVATLIVAIIGATFAYFSASAQSDTDAINTTSTSLSLGFEDDSTGIKTNLIPAYDNIALAGAQKTTDKCIDDNGNVICSIYEFTIGNPSTTTAQKVYGSIEITTNTFVNLYFRIYDITNADDYTTEVVTPTNFTTATDKKIALEDVKADEDGTLNITLNPTSSEPSDATKPSTFGNSINNDKSNVKKYRMIIWLRDIGSDQTTGENNDTNKSFVAGIKYTTSSNGSGVTGVIGTTTGQNFGS